MKSVNYILNNPIINSWYFKVIQTLIYILWTCENIINDIDKRPLYIIILLFAKNTGWKEKQISRAASA
jgi:hypothetical protein